MTREEQTISNLKKLKSFHNGSYGADIDRAIKALEQEPCEDCISRQAALDYCYQLINVEHQQGSDEMNYGQERVNQTETILHHLEFMPSVRPEQKTGHWINGDCEGGNCSICGEYYAFYPESGDFNYCPNCGCRMVEPRESEVQECE